MQRLMVPTSVPQIGTVPGSYSIPDTEKGHAELKRSLHTGQGPCKTTIEYCLLSRRSNQSLKRFFIWLLISTSLSLLLSTSAIACYRVYRRRELLLEGRKDSDTYDAGAPFAPLKTQRLWGAYSPYYSVEEYLPPPDDCRLTQVNIVSNICYPKLVLTGSQIQRHGARYPTFSLSVRMAKALLKLQAAEHYIDPRLQFVSDYRYDLGTDDLLPFGEFQWVHTIFGHGQARICGDCPVPSVSPIGHLDLNLSPAGSWNLFDWPFLSERTYESGRKAFVRYDSLSSGENLPFVRASGSDRVIKSAFKWIYGKSLH